MIRKLFNGVNL